MKQYIIAALLASTLAGFAGVTSASDDHAAQHGGIVSPGKHADFELVAKPESLQLYVSDHGKKKDLSKASAKITLLSGTDKQQVDLKPAGDKLEATGQFKVGAGTKVVAVVIDNGKSLGTARFTLK